MATFYEEMIEAEKSASTSTIFEIAREYLLPLVSFYLYFVGATTPFYITLAFIIPVSLYKVYRMDSTFEYIVYLLVYYYYTLCYGVWSAFGLTILCFAVIRFLLGYMVRLKNDFVISGTMALMIAASVYALAYGSEKLQLIVGCTDAWCIFNFPLDKKMGKVILNLASTAVVFATLYLTDTSAFFPKTTINCILASYIVTMIIDQVYDVVFNLYFRHYMKEIEEFGD